MRKRAQGNLWGFLLQAQGCSSGGGARGQDQDGVGVAPVAVGLTTITLASGSMKNVCRFHFARAFLDQRGPGLASCHGARHTQRPPPGSPVVTASLDQQRLLWEAGQPSWGPGFPL